MPPWLELLSALIVALISSGTITIVLQLRFLNQKTKAETNKTEKEGDKLENDTMLEGFKAQISAATTLSVSLTTQIQQLNERATSYEKRDVTQLNNISRLEQEVAANGVAIRDLLFVAKDMLQILNDHLAYHDRLIAVGHPVPISEVIEVNKVLKSTVCRVEKRLNSIEVPKGV